jgi:hypothetical protein
LSKSNNTTLYIIVILPLIVIFTFILRRLPVDKKGKSLSNPLFLLLFTQLSKKDVFDFIFLYNYLIFVAFLT